MKNYELLMEAYDQVGKNTPTQDKMIGAKATRLAYDALDELVPLTLDNVQLRAKLRDVMASCYILGLMEGQAK